MGIKDCSWMGIVMRREEFDDKIRKMVEGNDSEKRIDELEKRVGDLEDTVRDLEKNLAEVMLVMLRMCPGGVGCPYADRVGCGSGTIVPYTGDAVRPWDITCTR